MRNMKLKMSSAALSVTMFSTYNLGNLTRSKQAVYALQAAFGAGLIYNSAKSRRLRSRFARPGARRFSRASRCRRVYVFGLLYSARRRRYRHLAVMALLFGRQDSL